MTKMRHRGEEIRCFILENVDKHAFGISKITADRFGISRQAVNKHLKRLKDEGVISENGKTKAKSYKIASSPEWRSPYYQISPELAEDIIWKNDIQPVLGNQPDNIRDIWFYGFTEMFNNAIDHSGGQNILVRISKNAAHTEMLLWDNGVGIFKKIQASMNLLDERHAILELAKGKLTTDPQRHTGEGIFFTSRMFDSFDILSGGVFFSHEFGKQEDWILEQERDSPGTTIFLKLSNHTPRDSKEVFLEYMSRDDYGFNKTVVPVKLAQYGNDKLISRSQAKRILARIEVFKVVLLNFESVPIIGQAFADEIFRVFANQHPEIEITAINANQEVTEMIVRAKSGGRNPPPEVATPDKPS